MDIILMERIERLGQIGDVVNVKPGFARNFLLPQGKAMRATATNKKVFEAQRAQLEASNLERKTEAEAVSTKMDGAKFVVIRQAGEAGHLYGSVNTRDIAAGLTDAGFTTNRNQVVLSTPIKTIGLHDVTINLHPEVSVTVTANVARSEDEAELQEQTGHAALATDEDEEEAPEVEALVEGDTANAIHEAEVEAEAEVTEEAPAADADEGEEDKGE